MLITVNDRKKRVSRGLKAAAARREEHGSAIEKIVWRIVILLGVDLDPRLERTEVT